MKPMKLSIVIPTFNRSALLRRTLEGLCQQTAKERIEEIIVVSDGSTDTTADVINAFARTIPVRLISQAKAGVSIARNRGLQQARGELILLLDDDVVPSPNMVFEHTDFHGRSSDLETVLLGYVTWLPDRPITPFMRWYGEYGALFGYALLKDGCEVDRRYLYTCNISFKTEFLRVCGGLNEQLTVYEDHELGFRLATQGMKMYFGRAALGWHNQTFTFLQACERIKRYSSGLGAFRQTVAGQEMIKRGRLKKALSKMLARNDVSPPNALLKVVDSSVRLPNCFYRLVYWYFATIPANKLGSPLTKKPREI